MTNGTAWKVAGTALLVAAAGAGAAFAQSGIATAPGAARETVTPAASDNQPNVVGPSTVSVKTGKTTKARRAHHGASAASQSH